MQIALHFYANHPNIIIFEPESGYFRVVPETDCDSIEKVVSGGWGVVIHERLYGLFKSQGRLSVIVNNQPTPLDDRTSSFWHAEGRKRRIEIRADAKPIFQFDYEQEEVDGLVYPMTTWDEEDSDFWLFLHNVINNRDRQARIAAWDGRQQIQKPSNETTTTTSTAFPKVLLALSIAIWAGANVAACSCPELFLTSGALAGGALATAQGRMRVYSHLALWASILMLASRLLG